MPIPGKLLTTAMAVMPHTDVERALELSTRAAIRGHLEGTHFLHDTVAQGGPPVRGP